jgi:hypothetical protein
VKGGLAQIDADGCDVHDDDPPVGNCRVMLLGGGPSHYSRLRGNMRSRSYRTLPFVRLCKMYQRKAMARDTVLGALLNDAPEGSSPDTEAGG